MATNDFQVLNSEEKKKIYDMIVNGLKVLEVPLEFTCSNCNFVPFIHYIFNCKHLYCRSCFNTYKSENRNCRKCQEKFVDKTTQDKNIEEAIYNLKAECPNKMYGCQMRVILQGILKHMSVCKYPKEKHLPKVYEERGLLKSINDDKHENDKQDDEKDEPVKTIEEKLDETKIEIESAFNKQFDQIKKEFETLKLATEKNSNPCSCKGLKREIQAVRKQVVSNNEDYLDILNRITVKNEGETNQLIDQCKSDFQQKFDLFERKIETKLNQIKEKVESQEKN